MNKVYKNFKKVIIKRISLFATIIGIVFIGSMFYFFGNYDLTLGNLGLNFFITEISLDILISLLFGLFIGSTVYKMLYFSCSDKKNTFLGSVGGFFGILVTGCPACSVTIASYLGLATIISVFPFYGIELKVISFLILLYVVYDTLYNLEICKIKK